MLLPILTALLLAGAGGGMPDSSGTSRAEASGASGAEGVEGEDDAPPEEKRVVARFRTVPPTGGKGPSTWSGTGRTWVWVGAAGLGLAGAAIGYHYLVDGEAPRDSVISLTD